MIKKIFSVFLTLIFLIPTTGIYYIKHTCLKTGNENIVFSDTFKCCGSEKEKQICCGSTKQQPCCNTVNQTGSVDKITTNHQDCCINEVNYLKDDSHYDAPGKSVVKVLVNKKAFSVSTASFNIENVINRKQGYKLPIIISSVEILNKVVKLNL